MNKKILVLLVFLLTIELSLGAIINSGDRVYFSCNNATSGALLGTAGNITCRDSAGNADVSSQALTNVDAGIFYYALTLGVDRYSCQVDCPVGAVDYIVPIVISPYVRPESGSINSTTAPTVGTATAVTTVNGIANDVITAASIQADAIGAAEAGFLTDSTAFNGADIAAILVDTNAQDTAGEMQTLITGGAYPVATQDNVSAIKTDTAAILIDTAAMDTSAELQALLTGGAYPVCTQTNLSQGIVTLTSATEGQIDAIETDTSAMDTSTELRTLVTGGNYEVATQANVTAVVTHGDLYWNSSASSLTEEGITNAIDARLNTSHGTGSWTTGSASGGFSSDNLTLINTTLTNAHGAGTWITATGFATQAQVDTECLDATEMTTATIGTATAVTTVNDATMAKQVDLIAIGVDVNTSLSNENTIYIGVLEINTTTKAIKGAIDGNASIWDNVADTSSLATQATLLAVNGSIISRGNSAWITATGFSTHSAADVWAVVSRTLTNLPLVGLNGTGYTVPPTVQEIDAQLNLSHPGNWSGVGGTAAISVSDIASIATAVNNKSIDCSTMQSNSLGCTVYSIETYTR